MLAFAQAPLWPLFWIFKMANTKYVFRDISASYQLININKYANPMVSGPKKSNGGIKIVLRIIYKKWAEIPRKLKQNVLYTL